MGEVLAHMLKLESLEVGAADDAGGEGSGGVVEESVDEGELTAEHDGQEGGRVEVELGKGVELGEDLQAHSLKFDKKGSTLAENYLKKTAKQDRIGVEVTGTMKGDTIRVKTLSEAMM